MQNYGWLTKVLNYVYIQGYRGVSRVICDCFLEALVIGNFGAPVGVSGGMPPGKVLKIDPQRRNLVHFEINKDRDNYYLSVGKFVCV